MQHTAETIERAANEALPEILAFLKRIGITVTAESSPADAFLPDMAVRNGGLIVDFDRLKFPGDLLHEAGHIAVTDPALRATLSEVSSDGGEEMAAMCWSYAAAVAIGIDPRIVFHDSGYNGGAGSHYATLYAEGNHIGLPMLQWYGMTRDEKNAAAEGVEPFPHMLRWLR